MGFDLSALATNPTIEKATRISAMTLNARQKLEWPSPGSMRMTSPGRSGVPVSGQLAVGELWRVADPVVQDKEGQDVVDVRQ